MWPPSAQASADLTGESEGPNRAVNAAPAADLKVEVVSQKVWGTVELALTFFLHFILAETLAGLLMELCVMHMHASARAQQISRGWHSSL